MNGKRFKIKTFLKYLYVENIRPLCFDIFDLFSYIIVRLQEEPVLMSLYNSTTDNIFRMKS